ncbi:MAG: tetratricopeptide repeat protein [Armatimonadetes bacterium]|nr:tetratricopeptide repeat protein [Armatimonadota bacterium]
MRPQHPEEKEDEMFDPEDLPGCSDADLEQAGFEADRNNPRIARELAQSVIRSEPNNVKARNLLSRLALRFGNLEAAIAMNAEALELDPTDETAQLVRAKLLRMQDQRSEAIVELARYCETAAGRQSVKAVLALTQLHREKGDYGDAERRLREAEQLAPNDPLVLLENLRLFAAQQRYAEILTYLANHRAETATDTSVLVTGAWILAASAGDHYRNEAKALFEQVISGAPKRLDAHLGLAQLLYRMGQIESAVRAYRRLLEIAPFHGNALNDLAWILSVEQGKHEEAVEFADRGAARYPNDPHRLDTHGVVMTKLGRLDEARTDLERSVRFAGELPSTKASALLHLAEVLARQGDAAAAKERFDEALAIHKTSPVFSNAQIDELRTLISER